MGNLQQDPVKESILTQQSNSNKSELISTQRIKNEDNYILQNEQYIKRQYKIQYIWIDKNNFKRQNTQNKNKLQKIINIQIYSSDESLYKYIQQHPKIKKIKLITSSSLQVESYKKFEQNQKISEIYIYCRSQQKGKLLQNNFKKISAIILQFDQLYKLILNQKNDIIFNHNQKINILFINQNGINLTNKYRINYHTLTNSICNKKSKQDFLRLWKIIFGNLNQIQLFQNFYQLDLSKQQAVNQTMEWVKKPGFFWQSTQILPKITTNPKILAYLRFPFSQIHNAILYNYKTQPKPRYSQVYSILSLTDKQLTRLKDFSNKIQITHHYITFSTFIKAYIKQPQEKRKQNQILMRIQLKPINTSTNFDFGFCLFSQSKQDANIIFNIYNVFTVIQYIEQQHVIVLQYGSLPLHLSQKQSIQQISAKIRDTKQDVMLLRNHYYQQEIINQITTQATVLQMHGYYEDAIEICKLKHLQYKIELGDAYSINKQYQKSQQIYKQISDKKKKVMKLTELYIHIKAEKRLQKILQQQIKQQINKTQYDNKYDKYKIINYKTIILIYKKQYTIASIIYNNLIKQMKQDYLQRYQSIPLVHQINLYLGICFIQLGQLLNALEIFINLKQWIYHCQGCYSPRLIAIQYLIANIYQQFNEPSKVSQCQKEIQRIQKQSSFQQMQYFRRKNIFINFNQFDVSNSSNPGMIKIYPSQ